MKKLKNTDELLSSVSDTINNLNQLRDQAYQQYSALIQMVVHNEITEEKQLERIMDSLLDFCDDPRFLSLYKRLCRHIFVRFPQLVGEHVSLYHSLFESGKEKSESPNV